MTVSPATEIQAVPVRLTVAILLGATIVLATALHAVLALRSPSPWIVPDELIYAELAKSLGDGGLPAIRDEVTFAYGIGYPALLAPVWAVFDDVTTAYAVAKVLNALILGLTAVPAYLLARRFVAEVPALFVAALSVAVPSMLYAGTLLTEVALYPAFVLALLAITAALERPAVATQAGALGAIVLASAIKMLAAVLVLAYVAAVALYHWLETREGSRWRRRLRTYAPTWVALMGALVAAATVAAAFGRSPLDALGAYAVVLGNIEVLAVPWWALLHIAELDLYVAVIPFAATILVAVSGLHWSEERQLRLFAAVSLPAIVAVLLTVAAYSSPPHGGAEGYLASAARLHERATFVLAPLFFIGLMVWLRHRPLRTRAVVIVVCVVVAVLPASIPSDQLGGNNVFQALALVPWTLYESAWPFGVFIFASVLAGVAWLAATSRLRALTVIGVVSTVLVIVSVVGQASMASRSDWIRDRAWGPSAAWVDRAVGDATVSVLWAEKTGERRFVEPAARHRVVWLGELFNRSVGAVYELGAPMPYGLPSTRVRLDDGRVVLEDGRPAPLGKLVLAPCHVRVAGVPIARDPSTGATVVRVRGPVRATVMEPGSCPAGGVS